jgi:hypothetical protein
MCLKAKEEVARLESEDRAQECLLKRTSLEKRRAELQSEQVRTGAALDRIYAVEAASAREQKEGNCRL